jgi:hypothetical protein
MSLDVYLNLKGSKARESSGIFVRENGAMVEISREEWDDRNPGHEPALVEAVEVTDEVYSANITHNLGRMAAEAGIYEACWRPEEIGITHARQLIEPLRSGIALMRADPPRFEKHNAPNGWGLYEHFVPWLERYLVACEQYPDAEVSVWR